MAGPRYGNGDDLLISPGGSDYFPYAAGDANARVVKSSKGRLCRIVIVAAGTAAVSIFDNTEASGTVLFTVAANTATGTIIDVHITAKKGICIGGVANAPALNVLFS